jgi:hypothetical protein
LRHPKINTRGALISDQDPAFIKDENHPKYPGTPEVLKDGSIRECHEAAWLYYYPEQR